MPEASASEIDVLIVGAGISGISMAAHLKMLCPGRDFAMLERRGNLGGTWDLFRYPGIRSDSDMHTFGFRFEPWIDEKAIADGGRILAYLDRVVDQRDIRRHIRFGTRVIAADWDGEAARWKVTVEDGSGRHQITARFLYLGSGYYDYDRPYDPGFTGLEEFAGEVVHPQFWPERLDYAGKRVVVVGSGATAVTLVPALAETASHVTMLQRTPTWMGAKPSRDRFANFLRRMLPERLAYKITRFINIRMHSFVFNKAQKSPAKIARYLTGQTKKALGSAYSEKDFLPPYGPWRQRLCLVPDGDLFQAVKDGRASLVTEEIERFDRTGIRLKSGEHLEADIVVTATGLNLAIAGGIAVTLDGKSVEWSQHWFYRSCMFSNVPNLAIVFGYLNAAWTLRADNTADYTCRVLNRMDERGSDVVCPRLDEQAEPQEAEIHALTSGYLLRARDLMPKSAATLPWRLNMDYFEDQRDLRTRPVEDGILAFETGQSKMAEAAE